MANEFSERQLMVWVLEAADAIVDGEWGNGGGTHDPTMTPAEYERRAAALRARWNRPQPASPPSGLQLDMLWAATFGTYVATMNNEFVDKDLLGRAAADRANQACRLAQAAERRYANSKVGVYDPAGGQLGVRDHDSTSTLGRNERWDLRKRVERAEAEAQALRDQHDQLIREAGRAQITTTICAACLKPDKWCPWRDDRGYVCAQCLADERDAAIAKRDQEAADYDALHTACLSIARGDPGWDMATDADTPATKAIRTLRGLFENQSKRRIRFGSELVTALVRWCQHQGPWDSGNPDHTAAGDHDGNLYNAAVRACHYGLLPKQVNEGSDE